jgi:class 3 adenylate cyclase
MLACGHRLKGIANVPIQLCIGIQAGPMIAGTVGERKFACDLWGDTVNTASQLVLLISRARQECQPVSCPVAENRPMMPLLLPRLADY